MSDWRDMTIDEALTRLRGWVLHQLVRWGLIYYPDNRHEH